MNSSIESHISRLPTQNQRTDCMALLRLFREVTERPGKMEDGGVVSFGEEGQLFGFAPRKHDLAVYISEKVKLTPAKLEKLGVHKKSGGCLFIKGLGLTNAVLLKEVVTESCDAFLSS